MANRQENQRPSPAAAGRRGLVRQSIHGYFHHQSTQQAAESSQGTSFAAREQPERHPDTPLPGYPGTPAASSRDTPVPTRSASMRPRAYRPATAGKEFAGGEQGSGENVETPGMARGQPGTHRQSSIPIFQRVSFRSDRPRQVVIPSSEYRQPPPNRQSISYGKRNAGQNAAENSPMVSMTSGGPAAVPAAPTAKYASSSSSPSTSKHCTNAKDPQRVTEYMDLNWWTGRYNSLRDRDISELLEEPNMSVIIKSRVPPVQTQPAELSYTAILQPQSQAVVAALPASSATGDVPAAKPRSAVRATWTNNGQFKIPRVPVPVRSEPTTTATVQPLNKTCTPPSKRASLMGPPQRVPSAMDFRPVTNLEDGESLPSPESPPSPDEDAAAMLMDDDERFFRVLDKMRDTCKTSKARKSLHDWHITFALKSNRTGLIPPTELFKLKHRRSLASFFADRGDRRGSWGKLKDMLNPFK